MRIYIFEPSEKWEYCGGAVVVIAKDIDEAITLASNYRESEDDERSGEIFVKNENEAIESIANETFVLKSEYELKENESARVVTYNYNYA
jgi:hypothetical protein